MLPFLSFTIKPPNAMSIGVNQTSCQNNIGIKLNGNKKLVDQYWVMEQP